MRAMLTGAGNGKVAAVCRDCGPLRSVAAGTSEGEREPPGGVRR